MGFRLGRLRARILYRTCYGKLIIVIHHIVLFKFCSETTSEQIDRLAKELEVLKNQIPGIAAYTWGPSVSIENLEKGYSHGFVMTFLDKESRDNYVPHPLHKELIAKWVDPICSDGLVFDIEENK